ncbi:MAG: hypothetical protein RXS25_40545, partial [Paraburkholderia sp.]|uniref:hypothetical protein n=1 Tax=Paraburkholderia sp. TaxID=1926495 RepID=UPI00397C8FC0
PNLALANLSASETDAEKTKPQETAISWGSAAIAGGDGGIPNRPETLAWQGFEKMPLPYPYFYPYEKEPTF